MISEDDLEYGDDQLYYYKGSLFTGLVRDEDEEGRYETNYVDGLENGLSSEWSLDGLIREQSELKNGALHGQHILFYPNGKIKMKETYEFGIRTASEEFASDGQVISSYVIDEKDSMWPVLENFRKTRS